MHLLEHATFQGRASTKATAVVAYLRTVQKDGETEVGFVMGKAKLAPQSKPTIM